MIEQRFCINVITDASARILLLKRCSNTYIGPGLWGFCAGKIESGETPGQCAEREIREELGSNFRYKLLNETGPVIDTLYGGRFEIWLFHYLWLDGRIDLNSEHTGSAWVSQEDYRKFDVVDGVDEDLAYLGIWPAAVLHQDKLPAHLKA